MGLARRSARSRNSSARRWRTAAATLGVVALLGSAASLTRAQNGSPKKILATPVPPADNPNSEFQTLQSSERFGPLAGLLLLSGVSLLTVSIGPMLFSGARGRRIDSVLQAKKSLQLGSLAELPTPDVGEEALASAYDRLFQELLDHQAIGEGKRRSFAVTSALEEEGRSSIVANLAMAAARRGFSVLVVDTDLRKPVQHQLFGSVDALPTPGMTDLLVGTSASTDDVLRTTPIEGIRLLSAGTTEIDAPAEMFGSRAMERFVLNVAPRLADLVLYDAPHLLSNEPGRRILQYVDGVLYAVRLGSTDQTRAKRGLEKLAQAGARVIGGVYLPKGYFELFSSVPVPGRGVGVEKPAKNAETVEQKGTPAPDAIALPEPAIELAPESAAPSAETDEMPMSNAIDTVEKPVAETSAGGMDDLESVLQGWRRRDTSEPVTPPTFETRPNVADEPKPESEDETVENEKVVAVEAAAPLVIVPPFPIVEEAKAEEPKIDAKADEKAEEEKPVRVSPFLIKPIVIAEEPKPEEEKSEAKLEESKELDEVGIRAELLAPKPVEEPVKEETEPIVEAKKDKKAEKLEEPAPVVVEAVKIEEPKIDVKAEEPVAEVKVEEPKAEEPKIEDPLIPVAVAPAPEPVIPVAAPLAATATEPTPAPSMFVASPVATPATSAAPVASAKNGLQELDVQIDMFPTAPGEMTMRAVTSNAAAAGIPNIVLEMTTQMHAMRGMRAITPSSGDPDAPRIALEASTTDVPDAAKMRILVGEGADSPFEAALKAGEVVSVRTGGGAGQPPVRLEISNDKAGGATIRATVEGGKDRQEVTLEIKREPLTDSFSDAKWRNRVSIFSAAKI